MSVPSMYGDMYGMTREAMDDEESIHHDRCPGCQAKIEEDDWTDKEGLCEYCSKSSKF